MVCRTTTQEGVLRPIGRRLDFVCMTHPKVVEVQASALREWLCAVPTSVLIPAPDHKRTCCNNRRTGFPARQSGAFWFDCFSEQLPPSPLDPLHIPAINTLIRALSVGILARPRRVFLFGFDGKIEGSDIHRVGAHYYRDGHQAYHAPHRKEAEVRRINVGWLLWDSTRFSETAPVVVRHMSLLFDLPLPPIYNVCLNSALTPFPRVSFDRFRDIVVSEGARP
jgi:hypothetical protein